MNKYFDEVRNKLMECCQQLQIGKKLISTDAIKSIYLDEERKANTLSTLIDYHNKNIQNILKPDTLKNYYTPETVVCYNFF